VLVVDFGQPEVTIRSSYPGIFSNALTRWTVLVNNAGTSSAKRREKSGRRGLTLCETNTLGIHRALPGQASRIAAERSVSVGDQHGVHDGVRVGTRRFEFQRIRSQR